MNRGRVAGGVICLAVAALLTVLNLTLPGGDMLFMVGGQDMPWVPVAGLAMVGVLLLATAPLRRREVGRPPRPAPVLDPNKAELNKRDRARRSLAVWGLPQRHLSR